VEPVFGNLFVNEPIPVKGYLDISELDKPGFGLELNPAAPLIPASSLLNPAPAKNLSLPAEKKVDDAEAVSQATDVRITA